MDLIRAIITGFIANRLRGQKIDVWFFNQDDVNAILYALCFSTSIWQMPIHYAMMRAGSATGWTEFLAGCQGRFTLNANEDYTKILSWIKITNQTTCFLWGCARSTMWVLCLQLGFMLIAMIEAREIAFIGYNYYMLSAIPLFYATYRLSYKILPNKDLCKTAEPIFGVVLWIVIYLSLRMGM